MIGAGLLRDERGTAFTEAIILALFFTFVFAAIMHMHGMFDAKLKTYAEVRGCSWAYANAGCEGGLPSWCAGAVANDGMTPAGLDQYMTQNATSFGEDVKNAVAGTTNFVSELMGDLTITGRQTTVEKTSAPVPRTPMLGGGASSVGGKYSVFCNEPKREVDTMVEDAFCRIAGSKLPGCG